MSETERLVQFNLLGQEFTFYTGASEEEMEAILNLVRQQVDDNNNESGATIPVSKIAVMACLNLASRYVNLQQDFDDYRQANEARVGELNKKIAFHFGREK